MEDQQADAGDLTTGDDATAATGGTPEAPPRTPVGKAGRTAKTEAAQPDSPDAEDVPAEAVTLVPHRPAGKRLTIAAVAAAVLFVGGGAFAGAMVQPYLSDRALVETKLNVARTAASAITTLWTYTPDNMDALADRASPVPRRRLRRRVPPVHRRDRRAQQAGPGHQHHRGDGRGGRNVAPPGIPSEATAIVYTNSVATSPVTKNIPSLRYLSYRLTMQRHGYAVADHPHVDHDIVGSDPAAVIRAVAVTLTGVAHG